VRACAWNDGTLHPTSGLADEHEVPSVFSGVCGVNGVLGNKRSCGLKQFPSMCGREQFQVIQSVKRGLEHGRRRKWLMNVRGRERRKGRRNRESGGASDAVRATLLTT